MSANLTAEKVDAFYEAIRERYIMYLEQVFFPEEDGVRRPLFDVDMTERDEFLRLQEAQRLALAGDNSPDAQAWREDRDGAQERFRELATKFSSEVPA